ncbi:MAG: flagellar hook-associated protein FlgK [Bradymonadia bacterium]
MSLFRTLGIGHSGMQSSQTGLNNTGHNIANAGVEGFTRRKTVLGIQEPQRYGGQWMGRGSRVDNILRSYDSFLDAQVRRDKSAYAYLDARGRTLNAVERLFETEGANDIGARMSSFFNAARSLSEQADDNAARRELLLAAEQTALAFRNLDGDLQSMQGTIDREISAKVDEINTLTGIVSALNPRIAGGELDEQEAADLRDQRDQALRRLSELVQVNIITEPSGMTSVRLASGDLLVDKSDQFTLATSPDPDNNGLMAVQVVNRRGGARNVTSALGQGELGGLVSVRDDDIPQWRATLDQLAFSFATAVNAAHQGGVGLDGVGGRDIFTGVADVQGAASTIAVDPDMLANPDRVAAAADGLGLPQGNTNALAMADLDSAELADLGGVNVREAFGELVYAVGRTTADNEELMNRKAVEAEQSQSLFDSVTGVSIDDEMIELTKYQRHFEASARVITTVDQLLDSVLALVG